MDNVRCTVFLICLIGARAENAYHRPHYRAGRLWCKVVDCDQGEEAALCSRGLPETTECVRCDPGTFMNRSTRSIEGIRCSNKRVCSWNEGLILWKENDATKNRQCVCDVSLGYYSMDYDPNDPDYSTENCVYCPWNDSYIDPDRGCSTCLGVIYLDFGEYKRCKQNTSTVTDITIPSVQDQPQDDSVAEEFESKVINESPTHGINSLSSLHICVIVGVVVGFILVAACLAYLIQRWRVKRRKERCNRRMRPETPPLHVARPPRDGTLESQPVLANADPSTPRPNVFVRPLRQAAGSSSPTTSGSYDLVSDVLMAKETDGITTRDAAKPAENGGPQIQCMYYFANGSDVNVKGGYKGMFANGNIGNSVIGQRLANDRKTDVPVRDSTAVNINIQPAVAATADPHENLTPENVHSAAPETAYSVVERTADPVQEVGDSRLHANTVPKTP